MNFSGIVISLAFMCAFIGFTIGIITGNSLR